MAKLIMLSGLPASGKSTRAKEILHAGNYVRVNRDLLRTMLHFDKFSGRNESMTVLAEQQIVKRLLQDGTNVVVDDCNLNPKNLEMWKDVAKRSDATFSHEVVGTPFDTCVSRDKHREKKVGEQVITEMALQYGLYPTPEKGVVLCDLDGTLCNIDHRLHHVKGEGKKDWKGFFDGIIDDTLRNEVSEMLEGYINKGHTIFLVSARPDTYREVTENWLKNQYTIPPHNALFMRRGGDSREDTIVKSEMFDKYFKNLPIEAIIDDRPSVIRMWREKGLNVIDVGEGEEF